MYILYLSPHDIDTDSMRDLEDEVRINPYSQAFTLQEFVEAFNEEQISNLGFIALSEEG